MARIVPITASAVVVLVPVVLGGCRAPGDEGTSSVEATAAEATAQPVAADEGTGDEGTAPSEPTVTVASQTDLDMPAIREMVEDIATTIGEREAGTENLVKTAQYIKDKLEALGYTATVTDYEIPNGSTSHNVIAATAAEGPRIALATHMDTVAGCPCANDDATGMASVIDIARILKERGLDTEIPLQFVFLGAEEEIEGYEGHGYSAIKFLEQLPGDQLDRICAAVWLDKLGRGEDFLALVIEETSDEAANLYVDAIGEDAPKPEVRVVKRWSEDMAFEDHGIPTVWVEWSKDRHLHQPTDTPESIDWEKVAAAADGTLKLVLSKSWMAEA